MNAFVRTNHTTNSLLNFSKIVAVLLLISLPIVAQAQVTNRYQSSYNRYVAPASVGAQAVQYQPESYQMTQTSTYQMGTTLNPAQTVYTPFSNENPGNSGSNDLGSIGGETESVGKDGFINPEDPGFRPPIGDPWSLLVFAVISAGVIYFKQRKKVEAKG